MSEVKLKKRSFKERLHILSDRLKKVMSSRDYDEDTVTCSMMATLLANEFDVVEKEFEEAFKTDKIYRIHIVYKKLFGE